MLTTCAVANNASFFLKKIDELLYAPYGQRGDEDVLQHCENELEMPAKAFYFSVKTMLVVGSLLPRVLLH